MAMERKEQEVQAEKKVEETVNPVSDILTEASTVSEAETKTIRSIAPPEGLTAQELESIEQQAEAAIKTLVNAKGSEALDLTDKIGNIGLKRQQLASVEMGLMQEKMGRLLRKDAKDPVAVKLAEEMDKLEETLNLINPSAIQKETWFRILGMLPFGLGNRLVRTLKIAARRSQTIGQFVKKIEESLEEGRNMLVHDNAQLKVAYRNVETTEADIRKNAYLARLVFESLSKVIEETKDLKKKQELRNVHFRVAVRAQDLYAMVYVYQQFMTSIRMTMENNELLIGSINRMLSMGMQVVYVALLIAAALARQRDVMAVYKQTREFIGSTIAANAETVRRHVDEIGDILKEPVVAMKKLEEAHATMLDAIGKMDQIKTAVIENSRQNMDKLEKMSKELKERTEGTQATEQASLELENLPVKPASSPERPNIAR